MSDDKLRALRVNDTEVTTQVVGNKALANSAADNVSLEVDSDNGYLQIKTAGTALGNGVQRAMMSKFAGAPFQGDLVASDAAAGVFSVENTYSTDLMVDRMIIDITTVATGACTLDIGNAATAISANTLLDGVDVNAATGPFDNVDDQGASGQSIVKWPSGEFITASMASGATSGLVGTYWFHAVDMN